MAKAILLVKKLDVTDGLVEFIDSHGAKEIDEPVGSTIRAFEVPYIDGKFEFLEYDLTLHFTGKYLLDYF